MMVNRIETVCTGQWMKLPLSKNNLKVSGKKKKMALTFSGCGNETRLFHHQM